MCFRMILILTSLYIGAMIILVICALVFGMINGFFLYLIKYKNKSFVRVYMTVAPLFVAVMLMTLYHWTLGVAGFIIMCFIGHLYDLIWQDRKMIFKYNKQVKQK